MTEPYLLSQPKTPAKKIWKRWKWIGLAVYGAVLIFGRWLPGWIVALGYVYGIVAAGNLLFHLFRYLKNRLFWRVRNRLISSFFFVGVIPLLLLLGIVLLTGYVLFGQLAGRYLEGALQEEEQRVAAVNVELAGRITSARSEPDFPVLAKQVFARHAARFPRLAARLLREDTQGVCDVVASYDPQRIGKETATYPCSEWLGGLTTFLGLVGEENSVRMTSLRSVDASDKLFLVVSAPVDSVIEERVQREKSIYFVLLATGKTNVTINPTSAQVTVSGQDGREKADDSNALRRLETRRKGDLRRMVSWGTVLDGWNYATGKKQPLAFAVLHVPLQVVYQNAVGSSDIQSAVFLKLIYVLGGMFVFAEIVSLVIGFSISRRITRSVHDMYQGTLALQKGELQHRIPVRRNDQLGLLAHSFNQMSASMIRLLEEVSEKKRLEQELEIAREVQTTLFPKQLPHPHGMVIFGGCEPARVVSGDYYDFIVEDEERLDIVVADISGKGISAALLMANLQALMRNQLLSIRRAGVENIEKSMAEIMSRLNKQIYLNSPPEKYATLFLSHFDAAARRLWYCNAGHLPPILLSSQGTQMLQPTGTVIGLLPDACYQASSVDLAPGTMIAIFTDGVTEALNDKDEEFGTERLIAALKEAGNRPPEAVYRHVIGMVRQWQGHLSQYDDITLIVARAG